MTIRNKTNLSIIIFVVLIVLMVVFVIYPVLKGVQGDSEKLSLQKTNLLVLEDKIENLKKYKTDNKNFEEILKETDILFVDSKVPIKFISFLETTSRNCALGIEISPSSSKQLEKDIWPSLAFQIVAKGSFPNILKFIEKLEAGPYLIEVQNFSAGKTSGAKDSIAGSARADFLIKVFTK